jgi:hypothetical protein
MSLGGKEEYEGLWPKDIPKKEFHTAVDTMFLTMAYLAPDHQEWAGGRVGNQMMALLLGIGMFLRITNRKIPAPPQKIFIAVNTKRVPAPESDDFEPFVYLANKIAMLPQKAFEAALKAARYLHPIMFPSVSSEKVKTPDQLDMHIKRWALLPGGAMVMCPVATEEDLKRLEAEIAKMNDLGAQVGLEIVEYLAAERGLLKKIDQERAARKTDER